MKKKTISFITGIAVVALAGATVTAVTLASGKNSESDAVYKEVTVQRGNLTVGVTESGAASLGTVSQEFELELTESSGSSSATATASATAASSGSGQESGMSGGSAQGSGSTSSGSSSGSSAGSTGSGSSSGSSAGSTGSGSSSGSSAGSTGSGSSGSSQAALEVETVYVTVGQSVKEGDALLKVTEESRKEYQEELEENLETASLALSQAQLNAKSQKLSTDYSYEENVANGSVAQQTYDAAIASLNDAVAKAQEKLNESAAKIADYQQKIAAGEDLSAKLSEEQENYSSLELELKTAQSNLTTKSVTAKQEYEEAMLNYNNASSIRAVDTSGIESEVEDAQEDLTNAQEALDTFQSVIGDGTIYAAYTGTVIACGCQPGDTLAEGTAVAEYADADAVTMTVSVSQEDIRAVEVGNPVEIQMTAYEDEVFEGQVSGMETSSSSGSSTVSYNVTVLFTGDTSKIYGDMTGNVTFVTKEVKDVLYVSNKAITREGTNSYVTVQKEDGTREQKKVVTGFSDGVNAEIQSGVEEGDTVLIEGKVTEE